MKTNKDAFGNRMKDYEAQTCGIKMMPRIPVFSTKWARSQWQTTSFARRVS